MCQDEFVASPRHADIEEASFLLDAGVAFRQNLMDEGDRQRQLLAPGPRREAAVDEASHEHDRELQTLGLVHGQHGDRVCVGIHLGRGRVVTCIDQGLEVTGNEDDPIVRHQVRLGPDDLEEAGDILEGFLSRDGVRRCQSRKQAAVPQELVENLSGWASVG